MANFTEKQIQGMIAELRDEFGSEIATRELALQTSRVLTRLCNKTPIRFMLYFSYDSQNC